MEAAQNRTGTFAMATTVASTSADEADVVSEGMTVVLDVNNGEKLIIAQVTKNSKIKLNKQNIPSHFLVGHSFGTIFETGKGKEKSGLGNASPRKPAG